MSYREVNNLRKAGNLESAIDMAIADYERTQDQWTASALFWCYNEKIKQLSGDELMALVNKMQELMQYLEDNDVAKQCMVRAQQRIDERYNQLADIDKQSKEEGEAISAYNRLVNFLEQNDAEEYHEKSGWIIYRALKEERVENVIQRKLMLSRYLNLTISKPSILHSLILGEAVKTEKQTPLQFMFTRFVEKWDLQNLQDEDWQRYRTADGHEIPSLVEKMISVYYKEVEITEGVLPSEDFNDILDRALQKWPQHENLPRYKARLLVKTGQQDEAISFYKRLLKITPDKVYLWHELSRLVDEETKMALLCKALSFRSNEEFVGKVRIDLARCLCNIGKHDYALSELHKVQNAYEQQGWALSAKFNEVRQMIPDGVVESDGTQFYSSKISMANLFVYSDEESKTMVKVGSKKEEQTRPDGRTRTVIKWFLVDEKSNKITIKPQRFNLRKAQDGTCYKVIVINNRPIVVTPIEMPNEGWIKIIEGNISINQNRNNRKYGFVGDIYVQERLLEGVEEGAKVRGVAIKQLDRNSGRQRWQCVALKQE